MRSTCFMTRTVFLTRVIAEDLGALLGVGQECLAQVQTPNIQRWECVVGIDAVNLTKRNIKNKAVFNILVHVADPDAFKLRSQDWCGSLDPVLLQSNFRCREVIVCRNKDIGSWKQQQ